MRSWLPYVIALVVGISAGMWGCRTYYVQRDMDAQRDTIIQQVTRTYSKFELQKYSFKIDSPKIEMPDYVFFEVESKDTIVKENKVYVQLPIQHYRTKVKEAEIFHSGVESKIDSLKIFNTIATITETKYEKERKHQISIYGSIGWMDRLRLPVGAKYLYSVYPWWNVGSKIEHDFAQSITGVYATTELTFGW